MEASPCTLFFPLKGDISFDSLKTKQEVQAFFNEQFQDALPHLPELLNDYFENPVGHLMTVKCDPWHSNDNVLLMGMLHMRLFRFMVKE